MTNDHLQLWSFQGNLGQEDVNGRIFMLNFNNHNDHGRYHMVIDGHIFKVKFGVVVVGRQLLNSSPHSLVRLLLQRERTCYQL